MPKKLDNTRLHIPYLDEAFDQYIKDSVSSLDPVIFKTFTDIDHKILRNLQKASLEQKLHLLGKSGKRFAIVIADRGRVGSLRFHLGKITEWFSSRIMKMAGPSLKHWGMFVRADKELLQNLSRLSLDINPSTMYLLKNYQEIAQHMENLKSVSTRYPLELHTQNIIDNFIKETYSLLFKFDEYETKRYRISKDAIPMLFLLSTFRDRYISIKEIALYSNMFENKVRKILLELVDSGHVQEDGVMGLIHPDKIEYVYQLTGLGVLAVNQLRDRITSNS